MHASKHASMQVSGSNQVHWLIELRIFNSNLNKSKTQFQLEMSLAQFSPSLLWFLCLINVSGVISRYFSAIPFSLNWKVRPDFLNYSYYSLLKEMNWNIGDLTNQSRENKRHHFVSYLKGIKHTSHMISLWKEDKARGRGGTKYLISPLLVDTNPTNLNGLHLYTLNQLINSN